MSLSRPHPVRPLEVGRVLARTFGVLRRAWMVIVPVAILLEWAASAALLLPSLAAAAQERLGLRRALVRTAALTDGNRLRIAALAGLFLFLEMVITPVIRDMVVALFGVSPSSVAIAYLPHALIFCFAGASQATLYWELVRLRDGAAPAAVDAIFA